MDFIFFILHRPRTAARTKKVENTSTFYHRFNLQQQIDTGRFYFFPIRSDPMLIFLSEKRSLSSLSFFLRLRRRTWNCPMLELYISASCTWIREFLCILHESCLPRYNFREREIIFESFCNPWKDETLLRGSILCWSIIASSLCGLGVLHLSEYYADYIVTKYFLLTLFDSKKQFFVSACFVQDHW